MPSFISIDMSWIEDHSLMMNFYFLHVNLKTFHSYGSENPVMFFTYTPDHNERGSQNKSNENQNLIAKWKRN